MKGLILAAGVGSRLFPLTEHTPKVLVDVGGRTLLEHQVAAMRGVGILDILVISGHLGGLVAAKCQQLEVHCKFNGDFATTNNLASLFLGLHEFGMKEQVLVINGDILIDRENLSGLISGTDSSILVGESFSHDAMKISLENGLVARISKEINEENADFISLDAYRLDPQSQRALVDAIALHQIPNWQNAWAEVGLQYLVDSGYPLRPFRARDLAGWAEIDTLQDLVAADCSLWPLGSLSGPIVLDIDGTVLLDGLPVGQIAHSLADFPFRAVFATNNSSSDPQTFVARLLAAGMAVTESDLVTSLMVAAWQLKRLRVESIDVFGTHNAKDFLRRQGFIVNRSERPEACLLLYHNETSYEDIEGFATGLADGGLYFASHSDIAMPARDAIKPDAGSFIELFAACTGRRPSGFFGKEAPDFAEYLITQTLHGERPQHVIGDNLQTDAVLARNTEACFGLVLSGVTHRFDVQGATNWPDFISWDASALLKNLGNTSSRGVPPVS